MNYFIKELAEFHLAKANQKKHEKLMNLYSELKFFHSLKLELDNPESRLYICYNDRIKSLSNELEEVERRGLIPEDFIEDLTGLIITDTKKAAGLKMSDSEEAAERAELMEYLTKFKI